MQIARTSWKQTVLLGLAGCSSLLGCTSPEEARQSSLALYEAGDVQGAIERLDSLPAKDYVAGNLRARYHISAAYHGGGEVEFNRAFESLREVRTPAENSTETGRYLTFLRFTALGNTGHSEQAGKLWASYCGAPSVAQDYRDCIRMEWAEISFALEDSRGEQLDRDLFAAAKNAYIKVYGWDPSVFQNPAEHRQFLERVNRAIAEGRVPSN